MKRSLFVPFLVVTVLFADTEIFGQTLYQKHANLGKGSLALEGYDPVSYFRGGPREGKSSITTSHLGVIYRFANEENRNAFIKNPQAFEPQYGGWCAYAMGASGEKVEVDPETYKILDGKLYLFYNKFLNNTLKTWNKDEASLHAKADQHWQKIYR